MFKPKLLSIAVLGAAIGVAGAAQAANSFDPLAPCSVALAEGSDVPALAVGFWAFGFLDAATGEAHEVNVDRLNTMIDVLTNECRNAPGTRMYDLATRLAQSHALRCGLPGAAPLPANQSSTVEARISSR